MALYVHASSRAKVSEPCHTLLATMRRKRVLVMVCNGATEIGFDKRPLPPEEIAEVSLDR